MQTRLGNLHTRLFELNNSVRELLQRIDELQQVQGLLNVLPKELQERFITEEREFIIYAHLKRSTINEPRSYSEFIETVRTFSNDFIGYPMVQEYLERKMKSDFQASTLLATAIILVILSIGMGWRWALLGVIPVGLGFLWMLGAMRLSGLDFNFANIIISSLLIGNGVNYAVYQLHGFLKDPRVGVIWKQTSLPILGSALTTMVSFGSLLFAATPGLRAFGQSALYGIGFTTLFTLALLPALLSFSRRRTLVVPRLTNT
jgi:predicted RND superfamily exporter protein